MRLCVTASGVDYSSRDQLIPWTWITTTPGTRHKSVAGGAGAPAHAVNAHSPPQTPSTRHDDLSTARPLSCHCETYSTRMRTTLPNVTKYSAATCRVTLRHELANVHGVFVRRGAGRGGAVWCSTLLPLPAEHAAGPLPSPALSALACSVTSLPARRVQVQCCVLILHRLLLLTAEGSVII
ncbi:hypothetical protein EVAR_34205_1 [Eumeta japonica]|uniref:Uncharacterized protein n=1 Tax=Eumeta variegata TaxID=151549 RepID=A0A4C1WKM8_EUMVA|nr:hypothetical protein EVAR_34205_1 [Eumeta japonica]